LLPAAAAVPSHTTIRRYIGTAPRSWRDAFSLTGKIAMTTLDRLNDAIRAMGDKLDDAKPRTIIAAICSSSSEKGPRLTVFAESIRAVGGSCVIID
jgi:hypothetical protein